MKHFKAAAAFGIALLATGLTATTAHADTASSEAPQTVTIGGQTYGAEQGLVITDEAFEVTPGGGEVGVSYSTPPKGPVAQTVWGSSYAFSDESFQTTYIGHAKAGANVYDGLRIVQVCFYYTQGTRTSPTTCANASFSGGSWHASGEVTSSFNDSLGLHDPHSIFHIQTSRIDPRD